MPATPRQRLIVAGALVDDLDRPTLLLGARRRRPPALAGRWELPGGKVEPGEEVLAALHRELAEELGIQVQVGELLPGPSPDSTWPLVEGLRMAVWWAQPGEGHGIPQPGEVHDQVRWLTREQLWEVPWLDPDIPIVRAIEARLHT